MDTLEALREVRHRACLKLQCMVREMADASDLRAHRALDDVIALRHVAATAAQSRGVTVTLLLLRFALELDLPSSLAQTSVLMDDQ